MDFKTLNIKKFILSLWNKGAFHIFIGSFFTKFVSFFGSVFLVRVLTKQDYGLLGYIENIYGYVYIFAGLGLSNALIRYVILAKRMNEKFTFYKYCISRGTKYNVLIVVLMMILFLFYKFPVDFKMAKILLIISLISIPFQFVVESNTLTYRAMLDNKRYAIITFLSSTILVLGRYIGAVLFNLNGVIIIKIVIDIFFSVGLCIFSYKIYFKNSKQILLDKNKKKEINRYSIQYMITNGIWAIFMLNDVFLLGNIVGNSSVIANYKVAYVLPGNLAIISTAIGIFVSPYFVKHECDKNWIWINYKKVILSIISIILPITILLFIFAKPIIVILYGKQYIDIVGVMRILLISAFVNSTIRYTTAHILSSMGQVKYNMIISFIAVIFQVLINIILIPKFNIWGAAITSVIIYILMSISLIIVFRRIYKIK